MKLLIYISLKNHDYGIFLFDERKQTSWIVSIILFLEA